MNRTVIRSALAGMRDEVTCSLCTGYLVDPHSLGCSHTFCRTCVLQELAENSRCPTCKLPMAPKELRPHTLIANILPCVEGLQPLRAATERPRASRRRRSKAAAAESAPQAEEQQQPLEIIKTQLVETTASSADEAAPPARASAAPSPFPPPPRAAGDHDAIIADQKRWCAALESRARFPSHAHGRKRASPSENTGDEARALDAARKRRRAAARELRRGVVIVCTAVSQAELEEIGRRVRALQQAGVRCSIEKQFGPSTTHVIASYGIGGSAAAARSPPLRCVRTLKFLLGVASGAWIVSPAWLRQSASDLALADPTEYEIVSHLPTAVELRHRAAAAAAGDAAAGDAATADEVAADEAAAAAASSFAPRRARQRRESGEPPLLDGLQFCIEGRFKKKQLARADLDQLISLAGGKVRSAAAKGRSGVITLRGDASSSGSSESSSGGRASQRRSKAGGAVGSASNGSSAVGITWLIQSISTGRLLPRGSEE